MDLMLLPDPDTLAEAGGIRRIGRKGIVPADGLEPSQTRFQRPVGCQLPYAGPHRLKDRRSDASTIPSNPIDACALTSCRRQRSLTGLALTEWRGRPPLRPWPRPSS